jgi:hypothetical protein
MKLALKNDRYLAPEEQREIYDHIDGNRRISGTNQRTKLALKTTEYLALKTTNDDGARAVSEAIDLWTDSA